MAAVFPIQTGNENLSLRTVCTDVSVVNSEVKKLIQKMQKTLTASDGCGLAAPQIGKNIRVIIAQLGKKFVPMVNPKVKYLTEKENLDSEGCLSVPGEYGKVWRKNSLEVEYLDEKGKKTIRTLHMFDARVVQHEIDHLDGILFTDRMTPEHLLVMEKDGA